MASRWQYLVLTSLLLGALACNAPTGGAAPATSTAVPPTDAAQVPATPLPPTPTADAGGDPAFSGPVRFTTDPNGPGGQRDFPVGVQEIWAVWDYSGMSAGDVVRRVWFLDGEVWLEREEAWDFARYGASGTIRDISVYDYEDGLDLGEYRLELFVNGVQQMASEEATFRVVLGMDEGDVAYPSPDGSRTAILRVPGTLLLSETGGTSQTLAEHDEIIDVEWFPDGQHLLYVTLDRGSAPQGPTLDWRWELWAIDVDTLETWQISQGDEQLHDPAISPQGDIVAVVAGSGYGDAGVVGHQLAFIYLDVRLRRNDLVFATRFDGIPPNSAGIVYPASTTGMPLPGEWAGIAEFRAILNRTFQAEEFEPGVYAFFLRERIAQRIGDLPPGTTP